MILRFKRVTVLVRDLHQDIITLELDEKVTKKMITKVGLKDDLEQMTFDSRVPHGYGEKVAEAMGLVVDEVIKVPSHKRKFSNA